MKTQKYLNTFRYISPHISKQERYDMKVFFTVMWNNHPTTKEILTYLLIRRNPWWLCR